jgi:hypothetical protein
MNEKIRNHVAKYNESHGWSISEDSIIETILESEPVHHEVINERRWWADTFQVVEIDGMLIGFNGAYATGDDSPQDKGWVFDPDTIGEVEQKEVTITKTVYNFKGQ